MSDLRSLTVYDSDGNIVGDDGDIVLDPDGTADGLILITPADQGTYTVELEGEPGVIGVFSVDILCETPDPTVEPTGSPTPSPTAFFLDSVVLSEDSDAEGSFALNGLQQLAFEIEDDNTDDSVATCTICITGANLTVSGGDDDLVIDDGECGTYVLEDGQSYTGLATQTNISDTDFLVESWCPEKCQHLNKFWSEMLGISKRILRLSVNLLRILV